MSSRRIVGGSIVLFGANVGAGLLSYLFQLRGARVLPVVPYGNLNAWMAYFGIVLSIAMVAQVASNFFQLNDRDLRRASIAVLIFVLINALGLIALSRCGCLSPFIIGVSGILLGTVCQGLLGQFQARMCFGWFGVGLLVCAAARLWTTYFDIGLPNEVLFYLSFPVSFGVACLVQSFVAFFIKRKQAAELKPSPIGARQELLSAAMLAFAIAYVPQIDLLNLSWTNDARTVGLFSQASLFAKVIFFAAVALLQVTLPFHVRAQRGQISEEKHQKIKNLEYLGIGLCVICSFVFALLAPRLAREVLGADFSNLRLWVLLSCLCLTALYGQLSSIQLMCAIGNWPKALFRIVILLGWMGAVVLWKPSRVEVYLCMALAFYLVLNVLDFLKKDLAMAKSETGTLSDRSRETAEFQI